MHWGRLGYVFSILCLGLSMLAVFVYSLFSFPERSVSRSMLDYPPYMAAITACLAGQMLVWFLYFRSFAWHDAAAVDWGYAMLFVQTVGWTGLITNLTGNVHVIFVSVFSGSFLVTMLILCHLVRDPDLALLLRLSVIFTLFCNIFMLVLFEDPRFYIPEHLAFIVYSLFFVAFFCAQDGWGEYRAVGE